MKRYAFFIASIWMIGGLYWNGMEPDGGSGIGNGITALMADTNVVIRLGDEGLTFDGIGSISAGASSRLLYDYPEPERGQILDYLFKPNYGAALQILKVEIGSDMNSTDGSEASHQRMPEEINCGRGYEWWLMAEAKRRNPSIKLYALAWGAPAWVADFWSDKNMDYLMSWLDCAAANGFTIDYMGGWNEKGYDTDWYIRFRQRLRDSYPYIQFVGADAVHEPWAIATEMTTNVALRDAVDIVGEHSACGWRTPYISCKTPDDARRLGKPLWNSEHSSMGHDVGAKPVARAINRLYIDGRITGNLSWSLVSAWYANFPIGDTGLMLAAWPWSGHYRVGKSIWAHAHTTQFAQPGWQYLNSACGYLPNGASFVTLRSPNSDELTVVVEAIDATAAQRVSFRIPTALQGEEMQLWVTNMDVDDPNEQFVPKGTLPQVGRECKLLVEPGRLYTLTTTAGQHKGSASPKADLTEQMELPYTETFEAYDSGELARYFADVNGGFEVVPAGAGRQGNAYRQMVAAQPISWWHGGMKPATLMGDPRWWGDYEVGADVLLEQPGYVELLGRVSAQAGTSIVGYHLQITHEGKWKLYSHDFSKGSAVMLSDGSAFARNELVLDSGHVAFKLNNWHRLALRMEGSDIQVVIDDKTVGRVTDDYHISGQVGLLVSAWQHARFDNVTITSTNTPPSFVPQEDLRIAAKTSEHAAFTQGYDYLAANAIDGRPETSWHSEWQPKAALPQSITIDLGKAYTVEGLLCQPRLVSTTKGVITAYNAYVSADGSKFQKVASGTWPVSSTSKLVNWPAVTGIRYVKFEATAAENDNVAVGEIQIIIK